GERRGHSQRAFEAPAGSRWPTPRHATRAAPGPPGRVRPVQGMTFDADQLRRRLLELEGDERVSRYLVGFSGGLDSTVLVHALKRAVDGVPVIAVHINHGLHADADAWEEHCRRTAATLNVDFLSRHIEVM